MGLQGREFQREVLLNKNEMIGDEGDESRGSERVNDMNN